MGVGQGQRLERNKRVPFRFVVRYGTKPPLKYHSIVVDLSDTGLFISTNRVFKPGINLHMVIEIEDKHYDCEGVVTWAKKVPPSMVRIARCGMGVRFTNVPQELLDLYIKKLA